MSVKLIRKICRRYARACVRACVCVCVSVRLTHGCLWGLNELLLSKLSSTLTSLLHFLLLTLTPSICLPYSLFLSSTAPSLPSALHRPHSPPSSSSSSPLQELALAVSRLAQRTDRHMGGLFCNPAGHTTLATAWGGARADGFYTSTFHLYLSSIPAWSGRWYLPFFLTDTNAPCAETNVLEQLPSVK